MIKKLTIVLLATVLGWLPSLCQEVTVKASLDSTYILIGAQANLKLEVIQEVDGPIIFPAIFDTITNVIEVLESSEIDSLRLENDLIQLTKNYKVTSFDSGYHVIPPFLFIKKGIDDLADTFSTNSLTLEVLLVPVDTSQAIKAIKAPEQIPYTFQDALPWLLGVLLLLGLIIGLWFYFKRRKKSEDGGLFHPLPKEAPHIIAFRALDKLKEEKLWQAGKVKAYHSQLTEIVRAYIEHRFQIKALERTSDEVLASIQNVGLENKMPFEELRQILYLADLVKFAKGEPKPGDNNRSFEQAYEFVRQTINKMAENGDVNGELGSMS